MLYKVYSFLSATNQPNILGKQNVNLSPTCNINLMHILVFFFFLIGRCCTTRCWVEGRLMNNFFFRVFTVPYFSMRS